MGQSLAERKRNVRTRQLCPHFSLLDTAGLAGMAGKIRNPKSETNSNEQRSKSSKPSRRGRADWSGFENLSFEFGACFGFRISDFGFVLAGQRCPAEKIWDQLRSGERENRGQRFGKGRVI